MKLLNHKIFFHEEFFGSRIYNTQNQEGYFFDKEYTVIIKKILSGNYKNNLALNEFKNVGADVEPEPYRNTGISMRLIPLCVLRKNKAYFIKLIH